MRALWLLPFLVACQQSDTDGYRLLCDSVELCDTCRGKGQLEASDAHIEWVRANVTNESALGFAETLQVASSASSGELLRAAARSAGVTDCKFAEHLDDPEGMHRVWGTTDASP